MLRMISSPVPSALQLQNKRVSFREQIKTRDRRCTQTSRRAQGENEVEASQANKSLALQ